jgi:D-alanyl-D-alanine carboxypeptidase
MTTIKPRSKTIRAMHEELGIPDSYANTCKLDFQPECETLVETETDVFGRQALLAEPAFRAWQAMQANARQIGIELQIVSGYRSAQYQKGLLLKKLERGETLEHILKVNAAPGYSEHHSGCAVDITTPGFTPLEEEFENSDAYRWLCTHAADFGFSMSFPRDNAAGMNYEPWHWKFSTKGKREKRKKG